MKFTFTKIAAVLAAMILLYSAYQENRSKQLPPPALKIDLIPIFSANTNVLVFSTQGWKRQVFGENHPHGLIAKYTDSSRSLVIYYTDAQHWDCQTAVSAHIESLSLSENVLWCSPPSEIQAGTSPKMRFCYASTEEGATIDEGGKSQQTEITLLHVVDTVVRHGTIFRTQSTMTYRVDNPDVQPSKNSALHQKAVEALEKVRLIPIDQEVRPQQHEFGPGVLIEA